MCPGATVGGSVPFAEQRERGQHNKCSPLELEVLVVERRLIELLPVRYL
jgi:hypothetical protein